MAQRASSSLLLRLHYTLLHNALERYTLCLPPREPRDPSHVRAQFGIVHDCDPKSPRFSLSLELTPFYNLF